MEFVTPEIIKEISNIYKKYPSMTKSIMVAGSDMRVNSGI